MLVARALTAAVLLAACKDPPPRREAEPVAAAAPPPVDAAPPPVDAAIVAEQIPLSTQGPSEPRDPPSGPPEPRVVFGPATTLGDMSRDLVRRHLKRNVGRLEACYAQVIAHRPAVTGTLSTQFTIGPIGRVVAARVDGVDDELGRCVMDVLRSIQFPTDGGHTEVRQPMTFRMAATRTAAPR